MALNEKDIESIRSGRVLDVLERDPNTVDWVDTATQPIVPDGQNLATAAPGPFVSVPGEASITVEFRKRQLLTELQALDALEVRTQYELGKRFNELKNLCAHGEFQKHLSEHLNGKSVRSAQQYITFYKMCEQVPALAGSLEKNYHKALTLRNALQEEGFSVEALNSPEFAKEITADAIDTMSAAQLKAQVKKLTKDVTAVVKEETKALTRERDELIKERDEALAKLEKPDWKAAKTALDEAVKLGEKFAAQIAVAIELMPEGDIPLDMQISIETAVFRAMSAAEKAQKEHALRMRWEQ